MVNWPRRTLRNARKMQRDLRHRVLGIPWLKVEPDHRFVFSYPRSGNTWLRHVIQHLTADSTIAEYDDLEGAVPTLDSLGFEERLSQLPEGLRFIKSHLAFEPYFLDGKVIYMVRDGRDVLISYFDYYRHIKSYPGTLDQFLEKFTRGWLRYGTWRDNVGSWVEHRDDPNLLLVRFEDMRADPLTTLQQIVQFSGIEADEMRMRAAIEASSVEKVHSTMRTFHSAKRTEFSGGASDGGKRSWRERISDEQNRIFVDHAGDLLEALGYPLEKDQCLLQHVP